MEIPKNNVTQADLESWYRMQDDLRRLKAAEMLLRTKIFREFFPEPKEGTNNHSLSDGYVLKGKHTIGREVDPGTFEAMKAEFRRAKIKPDELVVWKPSLAVKSFRSLTEEQRHLFEQCLIVKPGTPSLEIVLAKKRVAGKKAGKDDADVDAQSVEDADE